MGQDVTKQEYKANWRTVIQGNILMMGLVSFFTDVSSEMIYPLLPIFLTGLVPVGAAAIYIGLMEGISECTASLLKIFSGRLSDAVEKRKLFVILGYGISTIFRPCMALAGAGWQVIFFRFGDRVGKGIRTSPRDALISDSAAVDVRGLAFSFHNAMDHAGAVMGPIVAIIFLYVFLGSDFWKDSNAGVVNPREMMSLRWLFGATLIPGLAAMTILIIKVREISPAQHQVKQDPSPEAANVTPLPKKFFFYLAIVTLFALGNSSDLFLVLYGKTKFGFGLLYIIGLWVALHISKIIFSFPGGILSDRYGRRLVIVTGWIIYALVYLGMAIVTEQKFFWLLILAYGAYYGMTEGAERALIADYVPAQYRGKAYGLYHGAIGIAALPASLLFGVFWMELGPQLAFGIGAALAAVASILLVVLLSSDHKLRRQIAN
jgi:MFS family permease